MGINPPQTVQQYRLTNKIITKVQLFQIATYVLLVIWLIKHW